MFGRVLRVCAWYAGFQKFNLENDLIDQVETWYTIKVATPLFGCCLKTNLIF